MKCLNAYWSNDRLEIEQGYKCLCPVVSRFLELSFNNLSADQITDAIQEALFKIHQEGQRATVSYCPTWVRTVAKNAAISLFRRERRHMNDRTDEDQLSFEDSDAAAVPDDMADQIQRTEAVEDVFRCLNEGSDGSDDLVIVRGLVNGDSHEEIGIQIGRTKGAVATRLSLIRKKLQSVKKKHF